MAQGIKTPQVSSISLRKKIKSNTVDEKTKKVSIFYLMPLFVFIINQGINLTAFKIQSSTSEIAFQDNPNQLIIRGCVYIIALFIFFRNFQENISLLKRKKLFLALVFYSIVSAFWSSFPWKVFINWGHLWGMMFCILAARIYFNNYRDRLFPFFAHTFSLLMIASIIAIFLFPDIGIAQKYNSRWQGIAGNPNSFGITAIASFWASLSVLYLVNAHKWYYRFVLLLSFSALIGSGSKTSIVVSIVIFLSMFLFVSLEKVNFTKKLLIIGSCGFVVAILILSIVLVMPELLGIEGATTAMGRNATFSGRTTLWAYGWKMSQLKPLWGWGFDSNMSVLQFMGGGYGQFHSGYLDLLVRGGSLGFFLVGIYILNVMNLMLNSALISRRESMLFLSLIVAILIHNITEASLFRGTNLFWFLIVFSYYVIDKEKGRFKR